MGRREIYVYMWHMDIRKNDMEKKWGPEFEEFFVQVLYVWEKERRIYIHIRYHRYISLNDKEKKLGPWNCGEGSHILYMTPSAVSGPPFLSRTLLTYICLISIMYVFIHMYIYI